MNSSHYKYLKELENVSFQCNPNDYYLWPRTPIGNDHQDKIVQRVGVSDYEINNKHSRTAQIVQQIDFLIRNNLIDRDFTILDIACGDAIVLWQIKKAYPSSRCYGIDCNKGKFSTHERAQQEGVQLFNIFIQHLFSKDPEKAFDLALMLNTYRGWESADLREREKDLPERFNNWFERNVLYTIVTAIDSQIGSLRNKGFRIKRIGKGEDNSKMICFSKNYLPISVWSKLLRFLR